MSKHGSPPWCQICISLSSNSTQKAHLTSTWPSDWPLHCSACRPKTSLAQVLVFAWPAVGHAVCTLSLFLFSLSRNASLAAAGSVGGDMPTGRAYQSTSCNVFFSESCSDHDINTGSCAVPLCCIASCALQRAIFKDLQHGRRSGASSVGRSLTSGALKASCLCCSLACTRSCCCAWRSCCCRLTFWCCDRKYSCTSRHKGSQWRSQPKRQPEGRRPIRA